MGSEFNRARQQPDRLESPADVRCPDRRSSGAKRLTPQLQIKVPTLRLWGAKLTVAVDAPALRLARGPSLEPSKHLGDGDIIWLVPHLTVDKEGRHRLARGSWEFVTLLRLRNPATGSMQRRS